jgi:hypothetical protein
VTDVFLYLTVQSHLNTAVKQVLFEYGWVRVPRFYKVRCVSSQLLVINKYYKMIGNESFSMSILI